MSADEQNPATWLEPIPITVIYEIATGAVDLRRAAQEQMVQMGIGPEGNAVGVEKARMLWGIE